MLNLVPIIMKMNDIETRKRSEFNKEISAYEACIKKLREMNEACFICEGKGEILRDSTYTNTDPNNWRICPYCNGTGLDKKE